MLFVLGAVVGLLVVVLLVEVQLARTGKELDPPDVATLTRSVGDGSRRASVLWLGDSTAAAVGTTKADGAVSSQVARELTAADPSLSLQVRVIAHSGDRVGDVVSDQLPKVKAIAPDFVVVSIGANDVIHLTRVGTFRSTYRSLIDGLVAAGVAKEHIVLVGVPDMGSPTRLKQPLRAITGWRSRRLDREVRSVANAAGTRYVDLFAATSKPFRAHPEQYLAADKYHPSDNGYALWATAISQVLGAAIQPVR